MTSKELVRRTVKFQTPERMAHDFPGEYGSDFYLRWLDPSPDGIYSNAIDEWGAVWKNIGISYFGQVVDSPLKDWADLKNIRIPDVTQENRWHHYQDLPEKAGDRFVSLWGVSLFERVKYLRGIENAWTDPYEHPDELRQLLGILVDMNLKAIQKSREYGIDGYFLSDDWGLQDNLLVPPAIFRELWLPGYRKIFEAVHAAGMVTLLHSCGYIVEILDDLIEAGLDVINMDQQENMGLELLGKRFGGRITFFSPVDIQKTMVYASLDDIRKYCRRMVQNFWRPEGGFMPKWYSDPTGAGHRPDAVKAMCEEFLKINQEIYG